jgi:hypothetical protein
VCTATYVCDGARHGRDQTIHGGANDVTSGAMDARGGLEWRVGASSAVATRSRVAMASCGRRASHDPRRHVANRQKNIMNSGCGPRGTEEPTELGQVDSVDGKWASLSGLVGQSRL